jgi:uncharacterized protein (TIGR02246 family)
MRRSLLLAAVCVAAASPVTTHAKSDAEVAPKIEQLIAEYVKAFNRHDAAALALLYTDDGVFVGPAGVPAVGRDAIEKFFAAAFKQMGGASETAKAIEIHALGENAWAIGEYSVNLQVDKEPIEVKGHWAAVYVPEGDSWKVRMLTGSPNTQPPTAAPMSGSSNK